MTEVEQAAADMYAFAAAVIGEVVERFPAPSAAPEARGSLQGLCRVLFSMRHYNQTLATGSPSDIENWRRDGTRIRAAANETLQELLDAGFPSLGAEPRLDDLPCVGRVDIEPEVERGLGHDAG